METPLRRFNPFRGDRRRWGRRHNPDGTMTLIDHLYELRYRLGVALLWIMLGAVFGFWWFANTAFGAPTLGDVITGPYCGLPESMRFSPNDGECQLLQTKPFEVFMIRLKVGVAVGAVLFSPVWLYQLWSFITPGLHTNERRFAGTFVAFASVLFVAGAVLAYFVVPEGLQFMVGFGGEAFFTALTGGEYINFVLLMLIIFGVSFELPLILVMLNRAGVVSYAKLVNWWRGILFGLFVFAAVATPGQDPISMLALAAALAVLFSVAMLICRAQDRRRARKLGEQGLTGAGLDEASDLDTDPSSLDVQPTGTSSSSGNGSAPKGTDDVT
ncbi:twin-arginine translocase subunit TatC [Allosaccharopolyspora coralli]|uniref:Sec-independent protein translocase protein TatC n=1 Tax=Allosaccharopolyspora coralli TaxID=2665642 RepID=A0A5Q3QKX7_9PSEU|nr:twin-arginine translocase subunit TatC [Allosaccharopolyspora coralli]QGK72185.1 twin-arginine translocase subunit TatC [Allosaccharopolyspora coralli]